MSNYLASSKVQQVSITIANGSLTGTATVNALGAGAFIIFQGETCADTANVNDSLCRVEITNSTTITATRGATGSSKSCVVNAVIVDGNLTSLIKSVQYGTIAMTTGQSTNTATINAVTDANTVDVYLGASESTSSTSWSNNLTVITRSGTTVTATKQFSGTALTAGYIIIEFQGAALAQSTQKVSNTATPSASSRTSTITSADPNNTILFYSGSNGNISSNSNTGRQSGVQTNATTLTFQTNAASFVSLTFDCVVCTFASGVLAQNVQRGRINIAAGTSNTATITSASTTNGFINWLGNTSNATTISPATSLGNVTQTNATTVTAAFNTSATGDFSWESCVFSNTDTEITLAATTIKGTSSTGGTTAAINTTGATLIVVALADYSVTGVGTISDSQSNTWTARTTYTVPGSTDQITLYYCANPTTNVAHTFTNSGVTNYASLGVFAFFGTATSSPYDTENGATGSTVTSKQPGSITPSQNGCVVVSAIAFQAVNTMAVDSSFNLTGQVNYTVANFFGLGIAYKVQTTAASVNPTWSWGSNDNVSATQASFKAPSTATGPIGKLIFINQAPNRASTY